MPRRPQPRRDALLRAAIEVVADRGVSGVTHRAVTERAGVPLTTVGYYFSSLDELVFEAARKFAEDRVAELNETLREATSAPRTPGEAAAETRKVIEAVPRWERLAFFEILCDAARSGELARPAREAVDKYRTLIEQVLVRMGAEPTPALVEGLFALHLGRSLLDAAHPDSTPDWLLEAMNDLYVGHMVTAADPDSVQDLLGKRPF